MSQWSERILSHFTADLTRLWVACDPDDVLLDEKLLSELRGRGFEVMLYEDPFAFRAEYEERYRAAWDQGEQGPAPSLVMHLRSADANLLPWDIVHHGRVVRLSLAELFPKLAYSVVQQVEPEHFAGLFHAHQTELQSARGENESKTFVVERVYKFPLMHLSSTVDVWRELLRLHFANRSLPPLFAQHAAVIIQGNGLFDGLPVATWLTSKSALLRVVQDAWYRYLSKLGLYGSRTGEPPPPDYIGKLEIPFDHSDVQVLVDSMFLDGSLHPLAVHSVPAGIPSWIKAGIVQDPAALQALVLKGIDGLIEATPTADSSHKDWSEFARRYGEILARTHSLPGTEGSEVIRERIKALQARSDEQLFAWVENGGFSNAVMQPAVPTPIVLHRVPDYLRYKRNKGESRIALLVFDGLALDQWVQIRERLVASTKRFAFDEGTTFAWLPTVTSVSRQALFSGLKPREFDDSIDRTDKEESLWKTFWQNEGVSSNEVMYRRALRQVDQLAALEADLNNRRPKVVGLVIDEVDDRLHKERSKKDVAMWIGNWLTTGFVDRLFSLLLDRGYHIYLTADHGNVESTGVGRPNQGVIAETRGERVRVYRSEPLLTDSAAAISKTATTVRLDIAGLPANFMPLFAGGRTAFVPEGEQVVVHGGVSIEELIVPFVKISYVIGTE